MLRVIGCITQQHDLRLVAVAALLCLFASATAMSMIWRTRVSTGAHRQFWLGAAGSVAGCGIWGTHFVAMLAFTPGLPIGYDPGLTALSVVIAAVLCTAGFAIALMPKREMLGGALTGAAISAMHYVGMAGLRAPAQIVWDANYVVASVVIGIILSAVAMHVKLKSHSTLRMACAVLLLTLAICGMHFTGMAAMTLVPDPSIEVPKAVLDPSAVAFAVAAGAVLILGLGLTGVIVDNHLAQRASGETERLRAHVQELQATKTLLENTTQNLVVALASADAANRAKSQFLAAMSHELRTPLNAVIGFADMMKSEALGPLGHPKYRDYLEDIRDSGAHLLVLINNVLDMSKMDTGALELSNNEITVADALAEILRTMSHQAKTAKVALSADIEPYLPRLKADRLRLRQILTNLVSNALKFTPEGGTVRLSARRYPAGLAIAVSDTGIGIDPTDIPKALDRFSQVDSSLSRRYEGAGLGLPLAKHLIELHQGRLEIASHLGQGTTVTVILPRERLLAEQQAA